jgi:hypothetical protein
MSSKEDEIGKPRDRSELNIRISSDCNYISKIKTFTLHLQNLYNFQTHRLHKVYAFLKNALLDRASRKISDYFQRI